MISIIMNLGFAVAPRKSSVVNWFLADAHQHVIKITAHFPPPLLL